MLMEIALIIKRKQKWIKKIQMSLTLKIGK